MTSEDQPSPGYADPSAGFADRMSFALEKDPTEAPRRTNVTLWILVVTLAWIVLVPILLVFGLTGAERGSAVFALAAAVLLLGPFTAAVIATRNQRFGIAGAYIVLTLLMIFPALAVAGL